MDRIIDLNRINNSLQDIKNIQDLTDEDSRLFQENIEKLDWYIKRLRIEGWSLRWEQKPNIKLLEDIWFYLFWYLTWLSWKYEDHISSFKKEWLNISALIFELLWEFRSDSEENSIYWDSKNKYFFYSSVCYSLSWKEANSIYISKKIKKKDSILFLIISKSLQRDFKGIINHKSINKKIEKKWVVKDFINILYNNALFFIEGSSLNKAYKNVELIYDIKLQLIKNVEIELLFIVSRMYEVIFEMINNSVWNTLLPLWFSKDYILSLTKYTDTNIYELWEWQRSIIKNLFTTEDNRVLVNVPTSGWKTQIAELYIIKELEKNDIYDRKKTIYIVPTNALANQIEEWFFNRFRWLWYKVSSNIDIWNDVEDINEDIIILTPEKLDLIIRKEPELHNEIWLFIFDEFHKISDGKRGLLLETLFSFLMLKQDEGRYPFRIITLSAIVDNLNNINKWFWSNNWLFQSKWTPTRKLYWILKRWFHVSKTNMETPFDIIYKYNNANS